MVIMDYTADAVIYAFVNVVNNVVTSNRDLSKFGLCFNGILNL